MRFQRKKTRKNEKLDEKNEYTAKLSIKNRFGGRKKLIQKKKRALRARENLKKEEKPQKQRAKARKKTKKCRKMRPIVIKNNQRNRRFAPQHRHGTRKRHTRQKRAASRGRLHGPALDTAYFARAFAMITRALRASSLMKTAMVSTASIRLS